MGRPARTYIQQLCEDTGCNPEDLPEAMSDREKWRETVRDIRADGATWWWWYIYILHDFLMPLLTETFYLLNYLSPYKLLNYIKYVLYGYFSFGTYYKRLCLSFPIIHNTLTLKIYILNILCNSNIHNLTCLKHNFSLKIYMFSIQCCEHFSVICFFVCFFCVSFLVFYG